MNSDKFVEELINQLPSEAQLKNLSESVEFIGRMRSVEKVRKKADLQLGDEVLTLVANYNADLIEIGQITFAPQLTEDADFIHIGKMEADYLVLNKTTREIQVIEHATDNYLLYKCAGNGAKFLDALIAVDSFLTKCMFDDDLWNDQKAAKEMMLLCADLAGGVEYQSCYAELLGYFGEDES